MALSREDWAAAALCHLVRSGPAAVAVEPVAELGRRRQLLLALPQPREELQAAALDRWEREETELVVAEVESAGGDARSRLRLLLMVALSDTSGSAAETRLMAIANHGAVREVVTRVTAARLGYLERRLSQAGLDRSEGSAAAGELDVLVEELLALAALAQDRRPP